MSWPSAPRAICSAQSSGCDASAAPGHAAGLWVLSGLLPTCGGQGTVLSRAGCLPLGAAGAGQQLRSQSGLGSGTDRASVHGAGCCLALVPVRGPLIPKTSSFSWPLAQHQPRKPLKRSGPLPSSPGVCGAVGQPPGISSSPVSTVVVLLAKSFSGWLWNGGAWAQGVRRKRVVPSPSPFLRCIALPVPVPTALWGQRDPAGIGG